MSTKTIENKEVGNCGIVEHWANMITFRRLLMKDDELYTDELFLLATIKEISRKKGRPVKKNELAAGFNILSYKRDKMFLRLLERGFINNDVDRSSIPRNAFKISLTPLGEQLLIKYSKAMQRLCEGSC